MRLDANGLDIDDPDVQALYAQQKRDQQAQTHVAPIPPPAMGPVASQIQQQLTPATAPPIANPPPVPQPAPIPDAATPDLPQPPPVTKDVEKTTRTREVPTKAEAGLNQKIAGDFSQQATLTKQEGDINRREANVAATGAEDQAKASGQRQVAYDASLAQHNPIIEATQARVTADKAKYDSWVTEMANKPTVGFYEGNEGKGRMVAHSLALALGELGRILLHPRGGGTNTAIDIIKNTEDTYYKDQRAAIEHQKDVGAALKERVGVSQGMNADARQSKLDDLNDLNLKFAARSQALADKTKAEGMRIGTEHAQVTADQMAAVLEQRRDMYLGQYEQGIRTKVSTESQSSTGTGTAGGANGRAFGRQSDLALFGTEVDQNLQTMDKAGLSHAGKIAALKRVQDNETNLKRIESDHSLSGAVLTNLGRGRIDALPRSRLDGLTDAQKRWVAANDVAEKKTATLLEKSTAPSAQHSALDRIALNPDDTPETMAQKIEERRRIARETIAMAGNTGQIAQRAAGGQGVAPGPAFTPGVAAPQAGPSAAAPGDAGLAAQAKATKPGDPLYDSAQRWLRAHGM